MKKLPILLSIAGVGILTTLAHAAYSLVFTSTIPMAFDENVSPPVAHHLEPADMSTDPTDPYGRRFAVVGTTWADPGESTTNPIYKGVHTAGKGDFYVHVVGGSSSYWSYAWDLFDAAGGGSGRSGEDQAKEVEYNSEGDLFVAGNCSVTENMIDGAVRVQVLKYEPWASDYTGTPDVFEFPHTVDYTQDSVKDLIVRDSDYFYVLVYQNNDACVAKVDMDTMDAAWVKRFDYDGTDTIPVQVVQQGDFVYVGSRSELGVVVTKLEDSDGDIVWNERYHDDELNYDLRGIAVNSCGITFVTAMTLLDDTLNPRGTNIATFQVLANGNEGWKDVYGGPTISSIPSPDAPCGIVLDTAGNLIVGGTGFMPGKTTGTDTDYIALKYASTGGTPLSVGYNTSGTRNEKGTNVLVDSQNRFSVYGPVESAGSLLSFGAVVWDSTGSFETNSQIGGGTSGGVTIDMKLPCTSVLGHNANADAIFMNGMARRTQSGTITLCDRLGAYIP